MTSYTNEQQLLFREATGLSYEDLEDRLENDDILRKLVESVIELQEKIEHKDQEIWDLKKELKDMDNARKLANLVKSISDDQ